MDAFFWAVTRLAGVVPFLLQASQAKCSLVQFYSKEGRHVD